MRVIYENLADTAATLSASTTSGSLVAANMQTDSKLQAHRSTGTSVTYTMTWGTNQTVGGVALPAFNGTSGATLQARLYSDAACTSLLADSTALAALPGWSPSIWGWTGPITSNAFALGGAAKTAVWFATQQTTVKGCKIDIVDAANPAGFIDCARLIVGAYWEPSHNPDSGAEFGVLDTTTNSRNDAGDLISNLGTLNDHLSLSLLWLPEADRVALRALMNNVGTRRSFLLSLLPGSTPSALERDHMIYGKRSNAPISLVSSGAYNNRLDVDGW